MNNTPNTDEYQTIAEWVNDRDLSLSDVVQASELAEQIEADASLRDYLANLEAVRQSVSQHGSEQGVPDGGYGAFSERLVSRRGAARSPGSATADDKDHALPVSPLARGRSKGWWIGPAGFGAAVAAAVIFGMISVGVLLPQTDQVAPAAVVDSPSPPRLVADRYLPTAPDESRQALQELWRFYDGQAGWIVVTEGDVRVGLSGQRISMGEPVIASLSITGPDHRASKTDIALVPGHEVEVDVPRGDGQAIHYRLKVLPGDADHEPSLRLTATLPEGVSLTTSLPLEGKPVREVGRLLAKGGGYQLHLGLAPVQEGGS